MYVCVCHAVTEDDVRGCLAKGACTARDVRAACGMKPGCGACTKRLYGLIRQHGIRQHGAETADESGTPQPTAA